MSDAVHHIEAALAALRLHAYKGRELNHTVEVVEHFTIAETLKRVDTAIGPKGESGFARIADAIQDAYTEILAARAALLSTAPPSREVGDV